METEKQIIDFQNKISILKVKWIIEHYKKMCDKNNTMSFLFDKFDTLICTVKNMSHKESSFELYLYLENSTTLYEISLRYCKKYSSEISINYINIITKNSNYSRFMSNSDKKLKLQQKLELKQAEKLDFDSQSQEEKMLIEEIETLEKEQYREHVSKFLTNHQYSESDNKFFSNIMSMYCEKFL